MATLDRVERRFGLACPEELCVHGRGLTATVRALVELFVTLNTFAAPGTARRSTEPLDTARPPESAAAPAFVPSACAITAPAVTRAAAAAAPPNTIIRTSSDPRSLALDHQTYHANVRLGPDWRQAQDQGPQYGATRRVRSRCARSASRRCPRCRS